MGEQRHLAELSEPPHLAGVRHRYIDLRDLRMHVAEAGEGDPVVLLHGWPQNWWCFRRLIPILAEGFRVICVDYRGAGWSEVPAGPYDKETMTDDLLAVLDQLGLERVRIIGHDVGGFLGFLACLRNPERVSHFIALGTGHPFIRPTPAALLTFWRTWYWTVIGAPFLGPWLVRHHLYRRALWRWFGTDGADWSRADTAAFMARIEERERSIASSKIYRSYLLKDSPRTLFGRYRSMRLTVPTLMLHGSEDRIPEPFIRGFEPYADEMRLELIPGVGHFIAEEAPQLVADQTLEWFAR